MRKCVHVLRCLEDFGNSKFDLKIQFWLAENNFGYVNLKSAIVLIPIVHWFSKLLLHKIMKKMLCNVLSFIQTSNSNKNRLKHGHNLF